MRPFDLIGQAPIPTPVPPNIRKRAQWLRPLAALALTASAVAAGAAGGVAVMRLEPATQNSPQATATPTASAPGAALRIV